MIDKVQVKVYSLIQEGLLGHTHIEGPSDQRLNYKRRSQLNQAFRTFSLCSQLTNKSTNDSGTLESFYYRDPIFHPLPLGGCFLTSLVASIKPIAIL